MSKKTPPRIPPQVGLHWGKAGDRTLAASQWYAPELDGRRREQLVKDTIECALAPGSAFWKIDDLAAFVEAFAAAAFTRFHRAAPAVPQGTGYVRASAVEPTLASSRGPAARTLAALRRSLGGQRFALLVLDHVVLDGCASSGAIARAIKQPLPVIHEALARIGDALASGQGKKEPAALPPGPIDPAVQLDRLHRALFCEFFYEAAHPDREIARIVRDLGIPPSTTWRFMSFAEEVLKGRRVPAAEPSEPPKAAAPPEPTKTRVSKTRKPKTRGHAGAVIAESYVLIEERGKGGEKTVWRAEDRATGREVAVGLMHAEHSADPAFRRGLCESLQHWSALPADEHVVGLLAWGWLDEQEIYMVMELVDGPDAQALDDATRAAGRTLPLGTALRIGTDAVRGLARIHEHGQLARDVSPGNIVIGPDGRAKITDLTLMIPAAGRAAPVTQVGFVRGKPSFLAPEQLAGQVVASALSDQHAMGKVLYVLLGGTLPPAGQKLAPLRRASPRVSRALERVVMRALADDPKRRFPSVNKLVAALDACPEAKLPARLADVDQRAGDGPTQALGTRELARLLVDEGAPAPRRRGWWIAGGVAAAGAVAVALLVPRCGHVPPGPAVVAKTPSPPVDQSPAPPPVEKPAPPASSVGRALAWALVPAPTPPRTKRARPIETAMVQNPQPAQPEAARTPAPDPDYASPADPEWALLRVQAESNRGRVDMSSVQSLQEFARLVAEAIAKARARGCLPPRELTRNLLAALNELVGNNTRRVRFELEADTEVRAAYAQIDQHHGQMKRDLLALLRPGDR